MLDHALLGGKHANCDETVKQFLPDPWGSCSTKAGRTRAKMVDGFVLEGTASMGVPMYTCAAARNSRKSSGTLEAVLVRKFSQRSHLLRDLIPKPLNPATPVSKPSLPRP